MLVINSSIYFKENLRNLFSLKHDILTKSFNNKTILTVQISILDLTKRTNVCLPETMLPDSTAHACL